MAEDKSFIPIAARPTPNSYLNHDRPSSQTRDLGAGSENENRLIHSNPEEKEEPCPHGFGGVNKYTSGTEFYGPTATLAFLIELRSRARSFQNKSSQLNSKASATGSNLGRSRGMSIVNLLRGDDHVASGTIPVHLSELEGVIILLLISSWERI